MDGSIAQQAEQPAPSLRAPVLAALGSVACVGLILTNAVPQGLLHPALILASVLWLAATFLTARPAPAPLASIMGSSVAVYAIAFILPATLGADGSLEIGRLGYVAFGVGLIVVPIAWFANPIYLVALAVARRGGYARAAQLAAMAGGLALSVLFTSGQIPVSIGYAAWTAAPGLLAMGAALVVVRQRRATVAPV